MPLKLVPAFCVLALLTAGVARAQPAEPAPSASPAGTAADANAPLIDALTKYFKADDKRARQKALGELQALPEVTFARVADALPKVQLWDQRPSGMEKLAVQTQLRPRLDEPGTTLHVRVPDHYDPATAYPLVLTFADTGRAPEQFAGFVATLIGARQNDVIIVGVENLPGIWFSDRPEDAAAPANALGLLKRRYHVDTRRVLAVGYGAGGYAAFNFALQCPDLLAAAMPLAAPCALETGAESADLFLPNLAHTPVLAVYGAQDVEELHPAPDETVLGGVGGWNRYLSAKARRMNVPFTAVAVPDAARDGIVPDAELLAQFLATAQPVGVRSLSLRFRYPEQGRLGWLRQTRFSGEPWTAQQIAISPGEGEAPEAAVRAVLTEKLAFLAGTVEGQSIRIETARCDRIEVLLSDALVDLDREITVHVDGTQRFAGKVERKLETLLEEARVNWDFQRPAAARLQISKAGRGIVN